MTTDEREPTFIGLSGVGGSDRPFSQRRTEPARDKYGLVNRSEGPDGQLHLSWDVGEGHPQGVHHFEIELHADGEVHFFYRNRATGRLEGFTFDEHVND